MKRKTVALLMLAILLCCMGGCSAKVDDPYSTACENGYTGSKEEWIAAFVGEEMSEDENEQSAFALACAKGYKKSYDKWMKDTTGYSPKSGDQTAYELVCEHGYSGSLSEWLVSICPDADKLGLSSDSEEKTEYEYACEYGFEGSFIEWLISLVEAQEQ